MANIKIYLMTAFMAVAYHYSNALPTVSLSKSPVLFNGDPIPFVDPKCNVSVEKWSSKCKQTVTQSWEQSKDYQEMIEAENEGDKVKVEKLQRKFICCIVWDEAQCIEDGIKEGCNEDDFQKIRLRIIEPGKQQWEQYYCQAHPFVERAAKCKKNMF